MLGSEYASKILKMDKDQRESLFESAFMNGDVPAFIKSKPWQPIVINDVNKEGQKLALTVYVSPFLAVGADADWLLSPMRPSTLQRIADKYSSVIVTPKLVQEIFKSASIKIHYNDDTIPTVAIKKNGIESNEAIIEHDALVKKFLKGKSPGDALVAGHSKNVVIGPDLGPNKLGIYGGYAAYPCGTSYVDGVFCQSYPSPHEESYVDYSQGGQFVFKKASLSVGGKPGQSVDLYDIFQDPNLSSLVSKVGPFIPRFPGIGGGSTPVLNKGNSGSGSRSKDPTKLPPLTGTADTSFKNSVNTAMTATAIGVGAYLLYKVLG